MPAVMTRSSHVGRSCQYRASRHPRAAAIIPPAAANGRSGGLYANPPTSGGTMPPVTFLLDEFGQIGTVGEISKALTAPEKFD
jgi:hypothetical protein